MGMLSFHRLVLGYLDVLVWEVIKWKLAFVQLLNVI
jgi:hypothetical protein